MFFCFFVLFFFNFFFFFFLCIFRPNVLNFVQDTIICDGVEAETRKSQASFRNIQVSFEDFVFALTL